MYRNLGRMVRRVADSDPPIPASIGKAGSDDFQAVTGTPFNQATIVDLLLYRVFLEQRRSYIVAQRLTEPLNAAQLTQVNGQVANFTLLAQAIVARRAVCRCQSQQCLGFDRNLHRRERQRQVRSALAADRLGPRADRRAADGPQPAVWRRTG